jgi:hypothetical protein
VGRCWAGGRKEEAGRGKRAEEEEESPAVELVLVTALEAGSLRAI